MGCRVLQGLQGSGESPYTRNVQRGLHTTLQSLQPTQGNPAGLGRRGSGRSSESRLVPVVEGPGMSATQPRRRNIRVYRGASDANRNSWPCGTDNTSVLSVWCGWAGTRESTALTTTWWPRLT